jgi:hypothetical protein
MRQDQFEALQARGEQLVDIFLAESDPAKWPGHGIEPANMEKTTRGDRYWCKKDAVATLACAQRIFNLVQVIRERSVPVDLPTPDGSPAAPADGETDLDREVAAAEKEAARLLDQVQRGARKEAFDKHVHKKA